MLGGLFKRWLGAQPQADAAVSAVRPEESRDDLYTEFRRTFRHRPGVNFVEFLNAEGITRMIDWLQPSNPCAVPHAFVQLAVDATRNGKKLWEIREPICINYEGNRNNGGPPSQDTLDALSVLAQILDKPVKLYYPEKSGGQLMVMEFQP